jgi:hypothetical protein
LKGGESLTFSATGKEEVRKMDEEKLLEVCRTLIDRFDGVEFETSEGIVVRPIRNLCYRLGGGDDFLKERMGLTEDGEKEGYEEAFSDLLNVTDDVAALSFSFGYALGRWVDLTEDQEIMKSIQRFIRKNHFLPYFPREKAA